jgi:integrase
MDQIEPPIKAGYLWQNALSELNDKNRLANAKCTFIKKLPPEVRLCEPQAILERKKLEALLKQAGLGLPAKDYDKFVSFVYRALRRGTDELGWSNVAVPARPISYHREFSCFKPDHFILLSRTRLVQQAVVNQPYSADYTLECGRLLLSAILFGGLVNKQWITPWFKALEDNQIFWNQQHLWFEMMKVERHPHKKAKGEKTRGDGEQEIIIKRRWFADPVTRLLICRSIPVVKPALKKVSNAPSWERCIRHFLKAASLPEISGYTVTKLCLMGEMALRLEVPPNLACYATGTLTSVPLTEPVWARIISGNLIPHQDTDSDESDELSSAFNQQKMMQDLQPVPAQSFQQQAILRKVRILLTGKTSTGKNRSAISDKIQKLIQSEPLFNVNLLLLKWSLSLLSPKGNKKTSTVLRYLGAIGSYLIITFEDEEISDQEPLWFQDLYEQVVGSIVKDKERSYALKTLGRFHTYLASNHGAPNLENAFFSGKVGPAEYTVDANLITCTEFDRVKHTLGFNEPSRLRVATAALLIAILGFRCGLRRNEAYYLRVRDIQGDCFPELLIRPYSKRGLKSGSSARRIPLYALLPKDELDLLLAWRDELSDNRNAPLFSKSPLSTTMYKSGQIFDPVRTALHQVTGDKTLRFHHLRHSCITWLFVRLNGNGKDLRTKSSFLDHAEFNDERVLQLRQTLLNNEVLGRKAAFTTALLAGHTDPTTTFRNYIHICDFLLGEQLTQNKTITSLNINQISNLSGIPAPTLFSYHSKKNGLDFSAILKIAGKRAAIRKTTSLEHALKYQECVIEFPEEPEMRWMAVMNALSLFQIKHLSVAAISEKLEYTEEVIQNWISNASYLANMRVPGIQGGYRHRSVAQYLELAGHDSEGREVWRSNPDIEVKQYYRKALHSATRPIKRDMPQKIEWKKSGSRRVHPDHFPSEPVTTSDKNQLQRIMSTYESLNKQDQQKVLDFADFYCESFILNSGGVWYDHHTWPKRQLEVIRILGIPQSLVQLVDHVTAGELPEEIKKRRAGWAKNIGIQKPTWITADHRLSLKRTGHDVRISVLSEPGGKASYAFRYAMYLIRIGYWD